MSQGTVRCCPGTPHANKARPGPYNLICIAFCVLADVDLRGNVQKQGFWHLLRPRAVSRRTHSTHFHVILTNNVYLKDLRGCNGCDGMRSRERRGHGLRVAAWAWPACTRQPTHLHQPRLRHHKTTVVIYDHSIGRIFCRLRRGRGRIAVMRAMPPLTSPQCHKEE